MCPGGAASWLDCNWVPLSSYQVWKLGWSPKPGGDFGTVFPEIPVEFLQEKEVFKEFIYRINTLGSLRSLGSWGAACASV